VISILTTLIVVSLLIILFYYFYRKRINTTFKQELDSKINEALAKYYNGEKASNYEGIVEKMQVEES